MSRKTVQISMPAASAAPALKAFLREAAGVDSWVTQERDAAEGARVEILEPKLEPKFSREEGVAFTIRLSAEPNLFDAAKVFFFLPQAALWFWGLGLAQRSLRGPHSWRP